MNLLQGRRPSAQTKSSMISKKLADPDRCFRQVMFVPLLNAIFFSYGKRPPFDKRLVNLIKKQLAIMLRFASEPGLQRRRIGRPSCFPVEAFRRYNLGERGANFYSEFIPSYSLMTCADKVRVRKSFYSAYLYFCKKQTRKVNKPKPVLT